MADGAQEHGIELLELIDRAVGQDFAGSLVALAGNQQIACRNVSGTIIACDRLASVLPRMGYGAASCTAAASGGCACSAIVKQTGLVGLVSPYAQSSGTYKTSDYMLTTDDVAQTCPRTRLAATTPTCSSTQAHCRCSGFDLLLASEPDAG